MPIFIHLPTTIYNNYGTYLFPRVLDDYCGQHDKVVVPVPCSYLPVVGLFDDSEIFIVDYIETSFTRGELCIVNEGEEFFGEPFVPQSYRKCIVMIPIRLLNEKLRIVIQTGEGWGWDEQTLQNSFCKRPDSDHKWNPFSKMWEKVCKECLQLKHFNPTYDLLNYMADDDLFGVDAKVLLCDCLRCRICQKIQYTNKHTACNSRY